MIAHNPLHGSGGAALPHPARALGDDAHAMQGIGTARGGLGISRLPREVSRYVHGVSDRAGLWCTSRYRCTRCCLPLAPTASASRSEFLTRLNTRPARSHATPPLRGAPHDSGPMWSLLHIRMTFAFTTPRRFNRRTGEKA